MNGDVKAIGLGLLVIAAFWFVLWWMLLSCTINIERVQVGPDKWRDEPQTIVEIPEDGNSEEN